MKTKITVVVVAVLATLALLVVLPKLVHSQIIAANVANSTARFTIDNLKVDNEVYNQPFIIKVVERPALTPRQIIWLARLMNCESGIKETAINPNDLDNTPSWGILQFKPATFAAFTTRYSISAELMDAEAQVAIVIEWLLRPGEVDWTRQFPACVEKLGIPPSPTKVE